MHVMYKIISKVLVNRLKTYLHEIVFEAQTAFIPSRIITDNILIAHDLMHSLKSRKRVSKTYMSIKTDIAKTYDRIEWNFLESTLRAFGFNDQWIRWIMNTVTTVEYSVLINENAQGRICPHRGLRQGNSLSPYLYILCTDVLSHMITSTAKKGKIRGIRIGNAVPTITHLLFAYDSLFFCQANNRNCKAINEVFRTYELWSGQQ